MAAILEVDRVSKSFLIPSVRRETIREHAFGLLRPRRFERLDVLDGVSFAVERGQTFGIMGRNGSGKSTLLRIVCGIYPPDRGRIHQGAPITPILALGVGWNPELDAIDNIHLLGIIMGMSLQEVRRDLHEILAFAEVERFANLQLKHYSSGMAMRLAYSVAFQAVREILILDEVFAVGDAGFKDKCIERQKQLQREGRTTVMVSHDPNIISGHCDSALVLEAGRVMTLGRASEVAKEYVRLASEAPVQT